MWRHIVICLILFSILTAPAQAINIYDEVAGSISAGIEGFIRNLIDDIISLSVSATDSESQTGNIGIDLIYSVATFTPNPYTYGPVLYLQDMSEDVYFEALTFLILITAIGAALHYVSPKTAAQINETIGFNLGSGVKRLLLACGFGLLIFAFEACFLWLVLLLNDELTKTIILPSLNAIAFDPENLLLYAFLGLAYGVLMLCFYFRTLIILFWAGFGILIGLLLIPAKTQDWALNAHYYLIQIVFYQFAIVAWYSFCIILIQGVPFDMQKVMYLIMVIVSVYFSYKFIFGINIIKAAGRAIKYVAVAL